MQRQPSASGVDLPSIRFLSPRWFICCLLCCVNLLVPSALGVANDDPPLEIRLSLNFGEDRGQAWGSLWEARDAEGRVIAGAGFQNVYNTQDRSDRRMLQVYVRTRPRPRFHTDLLPRPTSDAGTYLYGFCGNLYSYGRNAIDKGLKRWDSKTGQWLSEPATPVLAVEVAGKPLSVSDKAIVYGDQVLLELPENNSLRNGEWYYANGVLVVRQFSTQPEQAINEIVAYSWLPGEPIRRESGVPQALSQWGEFIYCFGQCASHHLEDCLVAASNLGSVHFFQSNQWQSARKPDGKSFQIYSSVNIRNQLWFGQYPTGELFQWAHSKLTRLKDHPPVMPGVSRNAREAQTMAIYGGELHVGVWPWGEVWRQDAWSESWDFLGRLFTHPEPTDQWTHPYEPEVKVLDPVLNRWGQRITSMVPLDDSLVISTSAKGPNPYEEKFSFLGDGKHWEYGAVHQYKMAGCLSVPLTWSDKTILLDFSIHQNAIEVRRDGQRIGTTSWEGDYPAIISVHSMKTADGIFGPFHGRSVEFHPKSVQRSNERTEGAYLHIHRHIRQGTSPESWPEILDSECFRMRDFGLKALYPFVSDSSGRAHFESSILPRFYTDGDPVKILADALRNKGIEFHPVVPVLVCGGEQPKGILLDHPEWALRTPEGKPMGYICPANPEARQWLLEVIGEVTSRYSPDGVLLDYLRYANRPHRLDEASEQRFLDSLPPDCSHDQKQKCFQEFKENELTELVREISRVARENLPGRPIAAYVWGPHVAKNHQIAQVWPRWIAAGYLDHINVSGYCYPENYGDAYREEFSKRLTEARELASLEVLKPTLSFALGVKTSHGAVGSASEIESYRELGAAAGMDGQVYFTWESLKPFLPSLK